MILTADVGNTNITCGVYNDCCIVSKFRIPTNTNQDFVDDLKKNLGSLNISGAIIGSVVDEINDRLCCAIENVCRVKPIVLDYTSKMPITLNIENNSELGADRIANGVRGWNLYKKAFIVVDLGTAITFDIVNSKGEFIGGLIAPGIKTQLDSLGNATSKLPNIEFDYVEKVIANNTRDAILAGVVRGTASMIDGMLDKTIEEMKDNPVIIGTGGHCEIISKYMNKRFDFISPDFTLEGLKDLYYYNA